MENENNSQNKNARFPVGGGTAPNRETDLEIKLYDYPQLFLKNLAGKSYK